MTSDSLTKWKSFLDNFFKQLPQKYQAWLDFAQYDWRRFCCKMQVQVVTGIQKQYIRNNKSNGQKNLRCFPHCASGGHRAAGFCGSSIFIEINVLDEPDYLSSLNLKKSTNFVLDPVPCINFNHVFVFAEFLAHDESVDKNNEIQEGKYYNAAPIFKILNSGQTKGPGGLPCPRPFLAHRVMIDPEEGEGYAGLSSHANYIIEPKCWHYGWKSHKHTSKMKHFLRVYAMYLIGNRFLCLGMGDSTLFTVASSKRFRRTYSDDMMSDISGAPIIKRHKRGSAPESVRKTSKKVQMEESGAVERKARASSA